MLLKVRLVSAVCVNRRCCCLTVFLARSRARQSGMTANGMMTPSVLICLPSPLLHTFPLTLSSPPSSLVSLFCPTPSPLFFLPSLPFFQRGKTGDRMGRWEGGRVDSVEAKWFLFVDE